MPFWPGKKTVRVQNNKRCDFDSLINGRQNAVEHAQKKGQLKPDMLRYLANHF